ncbi:MAG: NlpC/P60 family protein [Chloroflexota bacterium]
MKFVSTRVRAAAIAALMAVFFIGAVAPTQSPTEAATPASVVIANAKAKLGDPWVHYAIGPNSFDCSGLVYYAFNKAGYASRIGGRRSAAGYYAYFRAKGLASRTNPKPGDLVVWGGGSHIGIYIGSGMAISTLTSGVRIHRVNAVTAPFTTYLHTGMSGTTTTVTKPPTTTTSSSYRYTTTRVNLRVNHGTGYRIVRVLPSHAKMAVLAKGRDSNGRIWFKVRPTSSTTVGWVAGWLTRS